MPLINTLLEWKAEVILGGDGRSLHLLENEYPGLESIELPSYNVRYTSGSAMAAMTIALIPNYLMAAYREHAFLARLIQQRGIDAVISDNRYGMWSPKVPSVVISHQISIIPPSVIGWTMPAIYRLHRLFLHRFDQVWIPDLAGHSNLSGQLSHKYAPSDKMRYIGPLSRFQGSVLKPANGSGVLAVLSGPEPQRTILEERIAAQAAGMEEEFTVVQGKTESYSERKEGNIRYVSYMNSAQLLEAFSRAEVVVARSGYSTIMDLYALGKKAVFIPTPGQTEQEYLAEQLGAQGMAVVQKQNALDLDSALKQVKRIRGFPVMGSNEMYREVLREFTAGI
jgi:uncharacterized protein (TIGR00661 family)